MIRVIGLAGGMASGKTVLAVAAAAELGGEVVSFASPLRDMMSILNPFVTTDGKRYNTQIEQHGYHVAKRKHPEIRRLMETLGTDCIRKYDDDFWISLFKNKVGAGGPYFVDDIRFQNEADIIRSLGGRVLRIERQDRCVSSTHVSETNIVDSDGVIFNDTTRDKFLALGVSTIRHMMEE